ncbi:MAG: glycosyltransferase family 4 protein, partial [Candidatus Limnocylindria bacterium]
MFVIAAALAAGLVSALATPAFARLARRIGLVVAPRADRWHRQPTPLLGGAAIALGLALVLVLALPLDLTTLVVLVCATGAFALGLLDDFRHLAPSTKLVGQVMIASLLAFGGVRVELIEFAPASYVVTVLWVVGIMNAFNLIDNMDGLAAGVGAIAGIALAVAAAPTT